MHILLIHQYFKEEDVIGGARFNEMTRIWKDQGHDITVLAGNLDGQSSYKRAEYKGKFVKTKYQNGIRVIRCYVSESYNKNFLGRLWGYISFVLSSLYAGIFIAREKYDIILVTSPPLFVGITAYMLSVLKRTPFLFEVRDLWPESAIDTGILKNKIIIRLAYKFERLMYRKATRINVLTPAYRKVLIDIKDISPEKIITIPNGTDFEMSDDLLKEFNTERRREELGWRDKFVIIYVGAHGVANGLHQILDTAKLLLDTPVIFALVGDGMKKKELMEIAQREQIDNVLFYDSCPKKEVFKYVLAADVGTSVLLKNDTFKTIYSNKTFDYMGCKKPILMAIDGASRELVERANAGVFVEPEQPADFAQKIRYYMDKPELIKIHGNNGYQYAKDNFDRTNLALEYLHELLNIHINDQL